MDSGLLSTENKTLLEEILRGLNSSQKYLPSKLFYDEKGSILFDQICELDEYYPTRTELKIFQDNIDEIRSIFNAETLFIELGSGSSYKTKFLLEHIPHLAGYIPIDISEEHLLKSAENLKTLFSNLDIYPLAADYTKPLQLPPINKSVKHRIAFYPGSTIGNFTSEEAKEFLNIIADECERGGGLLIGVDLVKDKTIIEKAYNDSKGVTAQFNLNILERINREFEGEFDLNNFEHHAFFNHEFNRIEMHLVSKQDQIVKVDDNQFQFNQNESILTEYSHKFTLDGFADLASDSFIVKKVWTDENKYFSVQYLDVKP